MSFKELRKQYFRTSTEFANQIGFSAARIRKWESGASIPKTQDLKTIAKVLNISVEELLDCFNEVEQ